MSNISPRTEWVNFDSAELFIEFFISSFEPGIDNPISSLKS